MTPTEALERLREDIYRQDDGPDHPVVMLASEAITLIELAQCVAKMEGIEKYLEETRGLPSLEVVSRREQIKCLKRAAYAALAKLGG